MLRVEWFPEGDTPTALRAQVRRMQEVAWPSDDLERANDLGPVHDPALSPLSMLLIDEGTVVAALDILFAHIVHAGQELFAAGLSMVVTAPAHRRKGHGRALVSQARDALPAHGVDLGIFTCDRPLADFYSSCGWEILPGTVLVGGTPQQPFASDQPGFDKVALGSFLTRQARQARESLRGARVLLYCGDIDKLW